MNKYYEKLTDEQKRICDNIRAAMQFEGFKMKDYPDETTYKLLIDEITGDEAIELIKRKYGFDKETKYDRRQKEAT